MSLCLSELSGLMLKLKLAATFYVVDLMDFGGGAVNVLKSVLLSVLLLLLFLKYAGKLQICTTGTI